MTPAGTPTLQAPQGAPSFILVFDHVQPGMGPGEPRMRELKGDFTSLTAAIEALEDIKIRDLPSTAEVRILFGDDVMYSKFGAEPDGLSQTGRAFWTYEEQLNLLKGSAPRQRAAANQPAPPSPKPSATSPAAAVVAPPPRTATPAPSSSPNGLDGRWFWDGLLAKLGLQRTKAPPSAQQTSSAPVNPGRTAPNFGAAPASSWTDLKGAAQQTAPNGPTPVAVKYPQAGGFPVPRPAQQNPAAQAPAATPPTVETAPSQAPQPTPPSQAEPSITEILARISRMDVNAPPQSAQAPSPEPTPVAAAAQPTPIAPAPIQPAPAGMQQPPVQSHPAPAKGSKGPPSWHNEPAPDPSVYETSGIPFEIRNDPASLKSLAPKPAPLLSDTDAMSDFGAGPSASKMEPSAPTTQPPRTDTKQSPAMASGGDPEGARVVTAYRAARTEAGKLYSQMRDDFGYPKEMSEKQVTEFNAKAKREHPKWNEYVALKERREQLSIKMHDEFPRFKGLLVSSGINVEDFEDDVRVAKGENRGKVMRERKAQKAINRDNVTITDVYGTLLSLKPIAGGGAIEGMVATKKGQPDQPFIADSFAQAYLQGAKVGTRVRLTGAFLSEMRGTFRAVLAEEARDFQKNRSRTVAEV